MMDALYISAIGLQAQKEQLDAVANNLSNIGTAAFKRQSIDFSAILDRTPTGRGVEAVSTGDARPNRVMRFNMSPGEVHATGRRLDIAISGAGFIEVNLPGDKTGYSRGGSLQVNAEGGLSLGSGQVLKADVRVPSGASQVQILPDGSVTALVSGERAARVLGQIELATFTNPDSLRYRGEGVFTAPDDVEPIRARPGEDGTEKLATQSLEISNVNMTEEMVSLMLMQRIYELNSRVAQVADELMGMSNNMRRD